MYYETEGVNYNH